MPESPLAILTPQGHRVVWSMTGGGIPPGLAITLVPLVADWGDRQREHYSQYSITHVHSGKRVGPGFEEIRDARKVAEALGDCCDWQLPAYALTALPGIEGHVREILGRALTELDEEDLWRWVSFDGGVNENPS